MTIHNLILSLLDHSAANVVCRTCKSAIHGDDQFGRSEGVCAPCRRR
jgi:hypothetical protein